MQFLLDIPKEHDWRLLLPLLDRLKIEYQEVEGNALSTKEEKILATVKLYELGKISSGKAATRLGMTRVGFLEILGQYQVSFFGQASSDDLAMDYENA